MKSFKELTYEELKNHDCLKVLNFKTTNDIEVLDEGFIGQERAVKAFDFGLQVKMKGYNIYMLGPSGTGKTSYAKISCKKTAKTEPVPNDYCYVYNFNEPRNPVALSFKAGEGKYFKEDISELVELIKIELRNVFDTSDYEKKKQAAVKKIDDTRERLINKITQIAKKNGFVFKTSQNGMFLMPILDGVVVEDGDFENLDSEVQKKITKSMKLVHEKISVIMHELKENDDLSEKIIKDFDYKLCMLAISPYINNLREKYKLNEKAFKYLEDFQEDILDNFKDFLDDDPETDDPLSNFLPSAKNKKSEDPMIKYNVNLIVDNSNQEGAPVVIDFNPTFYNLYGEIEYDSEFGNLTTDFTKIKSGLIHKANGGYLIIQAHDLLNNPQSWEGLKRVLKTGEISIEPLREQPSVLFAPTLKPEKIPVNLKVILIGNRYYYDILSMYDEDFSKLFKIRSDFDYEMKKTDENLFNLAKYIKSFTIREKTPPFTAEAVAKVSEYSSRLVERQDKLSTRFNAIAEILCEAATFAKIKGANVITIDHINEAVYEKEDRLRTYENKLDEMMDENVIMIDTDGEKIGEINGLAVLDTGSYVFGKPTKITATTYIGESGIVNIEKEADLSGQTHNKGVQIISGYLGEKYAQDFPLSLSCRICFEQNYNGIDGDSASSTELYCILSSLSGLPIKQNIAVTGSVNQKGEIQAIGGATFKIEGFFDICNKRGFTNNQGVIIPKTNIKDLVLRNDVLDAVKEGKFHIYAVSTIDEGIEILTGVPAGEKDENGNYPENTVHYKTMNKLKDYYNKSVAEKNDIN